MQASSKIYNSLLEYSYFFNSRFNKLKSTLDVVVKSSKDIKSYKIIEKDPVTIRFKTSKDCTRDYINQVMGYTMSKQYTEYNYTIDGDSTEYIVTLDAGYIPMDDSLSDNTETVLSRSISRKIKAKMRSIELKNPDLYLGATSARVYSTFGKVEIVYNSLNKEQSNKYIEVIEDIIVSNGGNVLSSKVDVNTIIIEYEDNSSIMKPGTVNESENFNLYKKEQEYNDYLNNHIGKVVESFEDLLKYRDKIEYLKDDSIVSKLRETISEHDLSKYSDEEYIPYRKHFYPLNDEETLATEEYENAWLHHYSNNPHHWECWCILNPDTGDFELKDDIDEEEYKYYTIERICDWMSMSKIKNNRVKDWYTNNKSNIVQPDFIVDFIESIIDIVHNNNLDINME